MEIDFKNSVTTPRVSATPGTTSAGEVRLKRARNRTEKKIYFIFKIDESGIAYRTFG